MGRQSRKSARTRKGVDIGKRKLFDYLGRFFGVLEKYKALSLPLETSKSFFFNIQIRDREKGFLTSCLIT